MADRYTGPIDTRWLADLAGSVVKLFVTQQPWDPYQPWDREYAEEAIGSGFLLRKRILTNAHVIADASYIEMEIPGFRRRIEGRVAGVNHQVDLAMVEPAEAQDREELKKIGGITLGALPSHLERVVTVGYPIGGREVSYTAGVVSRVDILDYAHSNIKGLLVQTDAAINPGNSGGPVFSRSSKKCVGVATQGIEEGEGLGYFIPIPVIRQFLNDVREGNGKPQGISNLGCRLQPLENPSLREHLGIEKNIGVRVARVAKGGSGEGVLQPDDVIIAIEGSRVSADARVSFGRYGTVALSYKWTNKRVGDKLPMTIVRANQTMDVVLTLRPYTSTIIPEAPAYDTQPDYEVTGGLVFQVVDQRYLTFLDNSGGVPDQIALYQSLPIGYDGIKELVVIGRVLNASINKGYGGRVENARIMSVNGRKVPSLVGLRRLLAKARDEEYTRLHLETDYEIVFRSEDLKREDPAIARKYKLD